MTPLEERLKLLGDPTRFKILRFLADPTPQCCTREGGVCACDIEAYLGLSQPTVSHHMKQLVDAGLATREQRGKWAYFRVIDGALEGAARSLLPR